MKTMTREQQHFLAVTLPKFVLREQGRGFAMDEWFSDSAPGTIRNLDRVARRVPSCGTIACIGGSAQILLSKGELFDSSGDSCFIAKQLGLDDAEGQGLFYGWRNCDDDEYQWPIIFQREFARAKTTLGKATVAVRVLKLVAKTKGGCLHPPAVVKKSKM
jgi:hypothetical protein